MREKRRNLGKFGVNLRGIIQLFVQMILLMLAKALAKLKVQILNNDVE